jgi:hypothetical protein
MAETPLTLASSRAGAAGETRQSKAERAGCFGIVKAAAGENVVRPESRRYRPAGAISDSTASLAC